MVGGTDYDKTKFNLAAQGRRQPGSAFKTFALVAAVEKGVDPQDTYYTSAPVSISLPGSTRPWNVTTYGGNYSGPINLVTATLHSDNSVYAQLAVDVGAKSIVDVAHRMGITSPVNENPAIVLGGLTYGVSPFEMASAYGTLANQGKYVPPSIIMKVTDSTGKVLYEHKSTGKQAISAGVAYTVTRILEQNVLYGTGTDGPARPAGGRQDRHHRGLERRLVLRLHPPTLDGGLGGPPRSADLDDQRARHHRGRGHLPRPDMAQVHEPDRSRLQVPGLPAAQGADGLQPRAQHQAAFRRHRLPLDDHVEQQHDDHHAGHPQHEPRDGPEHHVDDHTRHHPATDNATAHDASHDQSPHDEDDPAAPGAAAHADAHGARPADLIADHPLTSAAR